MFNNNDVEKFNNILKGYMQMQGKTYQQLVDELKKQYNYDKGRENIAKKARTGNLKYLEVEKIADVLGYKIEWIKK